MEDGQKEKWIPAFAGMTTWAISESLRGSAIPAVIKNESVFVKDFKTSPGRNIENKPNFKMGKIYISYYLTSK